MIEQGSPEWFAQRCGLATASRFSAIITGTGKLSTSLDGYAAEMAADRFAGRALDTWAGNAATERGNELEGNARTYYELLNDVEVGIAEFVKMDGIDAGCSPDGYVGESGLIEIKCQLPKGHVQTLAYFQRNGTAPPDYIPQVQGQMWVTGRHWCDLFFFHPDLPKLTIRIKRDLVYIAALADGVKKCIEKRDEYLEVLRAMS